MSDEELEALQRDPSLTTGERLAGFLREFR
jgi:hypothetical protein